MGGLGQGLIDAVLDQAAVRELGQGVVVCLKADALFILLALGDVAEGGDIILGAVAFPPHGGDRQPFREHLAVLAAVPDLALPPAGPRQRVPHGVVEFGVVAAGTQDCRVPAGDFFLGVAGYLGEGRVDHDDAVSGIADQDGLGGDFEDGGGQPQVLLGLSLPGDVLDDPDRSFRIVGGVDGLAEQLHPDKRAVLAFHLAFDDPGRGLGGPGQRRPPNLLVVTGGGAQDLGRQADELVGLESEQILHALIDPDEPVALEAGNTHVRQDRRALGRSLARVPVGLAAAGNPGFADRGGRGRAGVNGLVRTDEAEAGRQVLEEPTRRGPCGVSARPHVPVAFLRSPHSSHTDGNGTFAARRHRTGPRSVMHEL